MFSTKTNQFDSKLFLAVLEVKFPTQVDYSLEQLATNPVVQGLIRSKTGALPHPPLSCHGEDRRLSRGTAAMLLKDLGDLHPASDIGKQPLHTIKLAWEATCLRRKQMALRGPGLLGESLAGLCHQGRGVTSSHPWFGGSWRTFVGPPRWQSGCSCTSQRQGTFLVLSTFFLQDSW